MGASWSATVTGLGKGELFQCRVFPIVSMTSRNSCVSSSHGRLQAFRHNKPRTDPLPTLPLDSLTPPTPHPNPPSSHPLVVVDDKDGEGERKRSTSPTAHRAVAAALSCQPSVRTTADNTVSGSADCKCKHRLTVSVAHAGKVPESQAQSGGIRSGGEVQWVRTSTNRPVPVPRPPLGPHLT